MKRKTLALSFLILVSGSALADSIAKASQKDIAMLLDAATGMNSAYRASLIGETHGRVYIEYETGIHAGSLFSKGTKRVVYWLPRSEITDEKLAQLRTYKEKLQVLDAATRERK